MDLTAFQGIRLRGGFVLVSVHASREPFADAIGRPALAKTSVIGNRFEIVFLESMSDGEVSVTLYHEVLEAATVAAVSPPESVLNFNEGDFERIAHRMHEQLGPATPSSLNRMLEMFDFATQEHER